MALDLSRRGRDRLADFADELGRALVEADGRTLRIRRLGVEIEHVLHARDIFGIDLRRAPHVLAPWLEVVFGQPPSDRLSGEAFARRETDQFIGQELQGPAGAAGRRSRAGGRHQQGFLLARELALCSRPRLLAERLIQAAGHQTALRPVDR